MYGSSSGCEVVAGVVSGDLVEEVDRVDGACECVGDVVGGGEEGVVVGGVSLEVGDGDDGLTLVDVLGSGEELVAVSDGTVSLGVVPVGVVSVGVVPVGVVPVGVV